MLGIHESRIEQANRDLERAQGSHSRRRLLRARVLLPIHVIDRLLGDLEQMNLAGRRRVPRAWNRRLATLVASLPGEVHEVPELRGNIAPTRLMDMLFALQDSLLDLKVGPVRHRLLAADERDELDVA